MKSLLNLSLIFIWLQITAQTNTWTGEHSINWNDSLNWSLKSVPNQLDTVLINQADSLILNDNITVNKLLILSSTINLKQFTITILDSLHFENSRSYGGKIQSDFSVGSYLKRNLFQSKIELTTRSMYSYQNEFSSDYTIQYTSNHYESIKGGNVYKSKVEWIHGGDSLLRMEQYEGSTYDSTVTFRIESEGEFQLSYADSSIYKGEVLFQNPGGGIFRFGSNGGSSNFLESSKIKVEQFQHGKLALKNIYVNTNINWSLSDSSKVEIKDNCHFYKPVSIISPNIKLDGGHFWQSTSIQKTGTESNLSIGSNIFESTAIIANTGEGDLTLANKLGDTFKGASYFLRQGTGMLKIAYSDDNFFYDNIYITSNNFIRFGQNDGTVNLIGDSITLSSNQKTYISNLSLSELKNLHCFSELIIESSIDINDCIIDMNENNLHLRTNTVNYLNGGFTNWRRLILLGSFQDISVHYQSSNTMNDLSFHSPDGFNNSTEFFRNNFTLNSFPRLYEVDKNPFDQFSKDSLIHPTIWSFYHDENSPIEVSFTLENGASKYLNSPHFDLYNFDLDLWLPSQNEQSFDQSTLGFKILASLGKNHFIINNDVNLLPIDLLSFTGKLDDSGVALKWISASFTQSSHFVLEKKLNENWVEIYRDYTMENSSQTEAFSFIDYDPLEENIYRLRHFDTNGECSDEWYQTFITSQHADLHSIINIQGQQIDRIQTSGVYFLKSESGKTEKRMVIID